MVISLFVLKLQPLRHAKFPTFHKAYSENNKSFIKKSISNYSVINLPSPMRSNV